MNEQNKNIEITEQDLFNYVFAPQSLSAEQIDLIEAVSSFEEIIAFYNQLKLDSQNKPDAELKKKLAEKITAYFLPDIIQLYQISENNLKQNGQRLAADSRNLDPKTITKTFVDNDNEYLIKVLTDDNITKVFVFSTQNEMIKDFDLIIEPDNLKYHLDDNSKPLEIDKSIEIEKIEIKFS